MEQRVQNEHLAGHLPTRLKGLDEALCGGIPFGPAGIGKTQVLFFISTLFTLNLGVLGDLIMMYAYF
jgi:RAD51-like protein 1